MIKVQNIYYMLAYAYQALSISGINAYSTEKFEYVDDLFAAILAKGISMQIKKGIQREYTLIQEEVSSPKGKIIQADTFRQEASQRKLVICEHDDYSENNRLNQILKLTIITPATVVDHVIPHRGNKQLFWDEKNWQPLCKSCHDLKTGMGL